MLCKITIWHFLRPAPLWVERRSKNTTYSQVTKVYVKSSEMPHVFVICLRLYITWASREILAWKSLGFLMYIRTFTVAQKFCIICFLYLSIWGKSLGENLQTKVKMPRNRLQKSSMLCNASVVEGSTFCQRKSMNLKNYFSVQGCSFTKNRM